MNSWTLSRTIATGDIWICARFCGPFAWHMMALRFEFIRTGKCSSVYLPLEHDPHSAFNYTPPTRGSYLAAAAP